MRSAIILAAVIIRNVRKDPMPQEDQNTICVVFTIALIWDLTEAFCK